MLVMFVGVDETFNSRISPNQDSGKRSCDPVGDSRRCAIKRHIRARRKRALRKSPLLTPEPLRITWAYARRIRQRKAPDPVSGPNQGQLSPRLGGGHQASMDNVTGLRENGDAMTVVAFKRSRANKDKSPRFDVSPWPVLTTGDQARYLGKPMRDRNAL
jgi:hypothetical protein